MPLGAVPVENHYPVVKITQAKSLPNHSEHLISVLVTDSTINEQLRIYRHLKKTLKVKNKDENKLTGKWDLEKRPRRKRFQGKNCR